MNYETPEEQLGSLFRLQREEDEKGVPSFESLLARKAVPEHVRTRGRLFPVLARVTAFAVIAATVFYLQVQPSPDDEFVRTLRSARALELWAAPSDVLLEPPVPGFLDFIFHIQ